MSEGNRPAAYEPTGGQINAAATALDELNWRSGSLTITTGMLAQVALAAAAEYGDRFPKVAGTCPMGCGSTLFMGAGGHVTCSLLGCPRPTAADELLHLPTEHVVIFDDRGWTLEHPARERVEGTMHGCAVHEALRELAGAPVRPGRYIVSGDGQKPLMFVEVRDAG
jgi:hypothetical protein